METVVCEKKSSNHFANEDIEALVVVGYFDPATHSSM